MKSKTAIILFSFGISLFSGSILADYCAAWKSHVVHTYPASWTNACNAFTGAYNKGGYGGLEWACYNVFRTKYGECPQGWYDYLATYKCPETNPKLYSCSAPPKAR